MIEGRVCRMCNVWKSKDRFWKENRTKIGLRSWCIDCENQYKQDNLDWISQQKQDWAKKDRKRNPDKWRAYDKRVRDSMTLEQRQNRAQHMKIYRKNHYIENKEAITSKIEIWRMNNPDKVRAIQSKYKAKRRMLELEGDVTPDFIVLLRGIQKNCYYCEKILCDDYHIEHKIPLSRGGKHSMNNIVLSCPQCNLMKHTKMPWEFSKKHPQVEFAL